MSKSSPFSAVTTTSTITKLRIILRAALLLFVFSATFVATAADFDPYQLNGGLVAAVAGRDFCLLAVDTRLVGPSGYEILHRHYTSSRLWSVMPQSSSSSLLAIQSALRRHAETQPLARCRAEEEEEEYKQETVILPAISIQEESPVWVGSVGCSTDCEQLKRQVQGLVQQHVRTGEIAATTRNLPASLAVFLGNLLYGRRGFPYYSFCVLAGCNAEGGHAYGYDAIGSYERLAVAVAGQGREILQSILDCSFHCPPSVNNDNRDEDMPNQGIVRRVVQTPTQVTETAEQARRILIDAFRAVARRDTCVGDSVVLLCWKHSKEGKSCIQPSVTVATLPEN